MGTVSQASCLFGTSLIWWALNCGVEGGWDQEKKQGDFRLDLGTVKLVFTVYMLL